MTVSGSRQIGCRQRERPRKANGVHRVKRATAVLFLMISCAPGPAAAGPFADDMARCLVSSTSPADRTVLVKWIFSVITLHPDLTDMASISAKQRDELSRSTGALFQRLLVDSCRSQTQQALQNEGPQTLQYAFQVLGEVATRGLFTDAHVGEGLKDLGKYVDADALKSLSSGKKE
jgi:hypothetical protein